MGCTAENEVVILQNVEEPIADAGSGATLTCTETFVTLDAGNSTGNSTLDYVWLNSNGDTIATTVTVDVDQPGIYTAIVTSDNGCSATDQVEVPISTQTPTADAGLDATIDCNNSTFTLGGINTSTGNNISYLWVNENDDVIGADITVTVSQPGTYTLIVTNSDNGCEISDEVIVDTDLINPIADAGPGTTLTCDLISYTIGGPGTSTGVIYTYEWQNSNNQTIGNESTLDITEPGTYTLIVTNNENGCTAENEVVILQNVEEPIADAGSDLTLTCDDPTTILDGSNSSGGNISFEWFDESLQSISQSPTALVGASGIYTLVVTNTENGCTDESTVEVFVNNILPDPVAIVDDILTCDTEMVLLDGSNSSSPNGAIFYEWQNESNQTISNDETFEVSIPGIYTLIVTDSTNGCTSSIPVEVLQDISEPIVDAGEDAVLTCELTEVELLGSASNGISFDYEWFDDNDISIGNTQNVIAVSTGIYTLVVTNTDNGCTASSTVLVTPDDDLPIADAGFGGELTCTIEDILLNAGGSSSGTDFVHQWLDSGGNILGDGLTLTVSQPGIYTLWVIDVVNDCAAQDNVVVTQNIDEPTAFIDQIGALNCTDQSLVLDGSGSAPFR